MTTEHDTAQALAAALTAGEIEALKRISNNVDAIGFYPQLKAKVLIEQVASWFGYERGLDDYRWILTDLGKRVLATLRAAGAGESIDTTTRRRVSRKEAIEIARKIAQEVTDREGAMRTIQILEDALYDDEQQQKEIANLRAALETGNPAAADAQPALKRRSGYLCGTVLHIGKRQYDMRLVSKSSGNRMRNLLNSDRVHTETEFDDEWLTPTVYFQFYTTPVVIHAKVYPK